MRKVATFLVSSISCFLLVLEAITNYDSCKFYKGMSLEYDLGLYHTVKVGRTQKDGTIRYWYLPLSSKLNKCDGLDPNPHVIFLMFIISWYSLIFALSYRLPEINWYKEPEQDKF